MTSEETQSESGHRRGIMIILILFIAIGGVLSAGYFLGGGAIRPPADDTDRPADMTDEEWADMIAYKSLPEKDEIDRLRGVFSRRSREKIAPLMEPAGYDKLLELTRHPNLVVRCQSTFMLGSFAFIAKKEPYASDPVSVDQMRAVHDYLVVCITDPSPHIRGWAFRILGSQADTRFIEQARAALKSQSKAERDGAEAYLVSLAKR